MTNSFNYIKYFLSPQYLPGGNIYYMLNNEYDEIIVSGFKPVDILAEIPYEEIVTLYFVNYNNPSVNQCAITRYRNIEKILISDENTYFEYPDVNLRFKINTFIIKMDREDN